MDNSCTLDSEQIERASFKGAMLDDMRTRTLDYLVKQYPEFTFSVSPAKGKHEASVRFRGMWRHADWRVA